MITLKMTQRDYDLVMAGLDLVHDSFLSRIKMAEVTDLENKIIDQKENPFEEASDGRD